MVEISRVLPAEVKAVILISAQPDIAQINGFLGQISAQVKAIKLSLRKCNYEIGLRRESRNHTVDYLGGSN